MFDFIASNHFQRSQADWLLLTLQTLGSISNSCTVYLLILEGPIVVVDKKLGKLCFDVDYLSQPQPAPDRYTMPKKEHALHFLPGNKYFSIVL